MLSPLSFQDMWAEGFIPAMMVSTVGLFLHGALLCATLHKETTELTCFCLVPLWMLHLYIEACFDINPCKLWISVCICSYSYVVLYATLPNLDCRCRGWFEHVPRSPPPDKESRRFSNAHDVCRGLWLMSLYLLWPPCRKALDQVNAPHSFDVPIPMLWHRFPPEFYCHLLSLPGSYSFWHHGNLFQCFMLTA